MTQSERSLLELVRDLAGALSRDGTELDGNWGWPSSREEFARIFDEAERRLGDKRE